MSILGTEIATNLPSLESASTTKITQTSKTTTEVGMQTESPPVTTLSAGGDAEVPNGLQVAPADPREEEKKQETGDVAVAPTPKGPREFSMEEVATHNKATDLWIVIEGEVFDITKFRTEHPGGGKILVDVAGKDATKEFLKYHRSRVLRRYRDDLLIGMVQGEAEKKEQGGFLSKFLKWKR